MVCLSTVTPTIEYVDYQNRIPSHDINTVDYLHRYLLTCLTVFPVNADKSKFISSIREYFKLSPGLPDLHGGHILAIEKSAEGVCKGPNIPTQPATFSVIWL